MTLTEKVAYLKGLIEGLELDETKPEGKIIKSMADILEDMALTVSDIEDEVDALDEYMGEIDEDLAAIEDIAYEDEDEVGDEDDRFERIEDWDDFDDDDEEFYEVMCPHCKEIVYLDETIDPTKVTCPACIKEFDITQDCCTPEDCEGCTGCDE